MRYAVGRGTEKSESGSGGGSFSFGFNRNSGRSGMFLGNPEGESALSESDEEEFNNDGIVGDVCAESKKRLFVGLDEEGNRERKAESG